MRTIHMSTKNTTDQVRISCDVRWQPMSEAVDPRYVGEINMDDRVLAGAWKTEREDDGGESAVDGAGLAAISNPVTIDDLKRKWGLQSPPAAG